MSFIDKALMAVAPGFALKRMRAQFAAQVTAKEVRRYEGAAAGRRTAGWKRVNSSANTETAKAVPKLRGKARDMEENNAWAARALGVVVSNVVGTGIRSQAVATNKRTAKRVQSAWLSWAESKACDFDGRHDFYGLQALAMRTAARDGEALIRHRWVKGERFPLKLQVLEADFLDVYRTAGEGRNRVIQGVEVDDEGRVVAYWLYEQHPGETFNALFRFGRSGLKSNRVPADEVLRVYRQDRAGQLRGVSWLAPVMLNLSDLDEYEDAQVVKQKISACFAAFVHDATGAEDVANTTTTETDLIERLEPGAIEFLPSGKDIAFAEPPSVDGFETFVRALLRKVAAGVGITYESLTGDLSQTNFSGGRMAWIEMGRNVDAWRWQTFIPQVLDPVATWWLKAAEIVGQDVAGVTFAHTPPRRELINPKEDFGAQALAIRNGLKSWQEVARENGNDPDTLLDELAADAKAFDTRGLVLDSDARKTTQQGQPRDKAPNTSGQAPAA